MNEPLISVIVPVYNVEHYIKRCVDSILAQTYTNLEIILVPDFPIKVDREMRYNLLQHNHRCQ